MSRDYVNGRSRNIYQQLRRELDALEEPSKQRTGAVNDASMPKIQKAPEYMAGRAEFEKYYLPQLISIGPIHYEKPYVKVGQTYKYEWAAAYLKNTNQDAYTLYEMMRNHHLAELSKRFVPEDQRATLREDQRAPRPHQILLSRLGELRNQFFSSNDIDFVDDCLDEEASWMLILDGCSVLQVLEKSVPDPERELNISADKLVRVHQDMLILDNQIPFELLRFLCKDEARLEKCLGNFLEVHGVNGTGKADQGKKMENQSTHNAQAAGEHKVTVQADDDPVHLLDFLRRALLMRDSDQPPNEGPRPRKCLHLRKYRIGTIRELKAAGIRVMRKDDSNNLFDPNFKDGILRLPKLTVDGSTAHIFLNLIAYEMCPDFRNNFQISSYVVFMSSLIDQPDDVKELISAGILSNELANDKEVADLFNKMDSVLVPETARFAHIRDQIDSHYESKRAKIKMLGWMGEAYNTYFSSPWAIIALLAASIGLILTFIQTWYAIHPNGS